MHRSAASRASAASTILGSSRIVGVAVAFMVVSFLLGDVAAAAATGLLDADRARLRLLDADVCVDRRRLNRRDRDLHVMVMNVRRHGHVDRLRLTGGDLLDRADESL